MQMYSSVFGFILFDLQRKSLRLHEVRDHHQDQAHTSHNHSHNNQHASPLMVTNYRPRERKESSVTSLLLTEHHSAASCVLSLLGS